MTGVDEQGRPEPPLAADEAATLLGFLDYQRATLAWKFGGVDAAGLRASVGVSSMTLGGLVKHPTVGWRGRRGARGRTDAHRACAGSCAT